MAIEAQFFWGDVEEASSWDVTHENEVLGEGWLELVPRPGDYVYLGTGDVDAELVKNYGPTVVTSVQWMFLQGWDRPSTPFKQYVRIFLRREGAEEATSTPAGPSMLI